jgi:hypothetical protein
MRKALKHVVGLARRNTKGKDILPQRAPTMYIPSMGMTN